MARGDDTAVADDATTLATDRHIAEQARLNLPPNFEELSEEEQARVIRSREERFAALLRNPEIEMTQAEREAREAGVWTAQALSDAGERYGVGQSFATMFRDLFALFAGFVNPGSEMSDKVAINRVRNQRFLPQEGSEITTLDHLPGAREQYQEMQREALERQASRGIDGYDIRGDFTGAANAVRTAEMEPGLAINPRT